MMPNDKLEILVKSVEKRQAAVDKVVEQLRAMVAKGPDDKKIGEVDKKIDEIEKRAIAIEAALKKILAKQADDLAKSETKAAQDLVNSEIKAAQKIEKTYMKLTEKTMLEGRLTILEGQIRGLLARG